jgi:hypothetical protein
LTGITGIEIRSPGDTKTTLVKKINTNGNCQLDGVQSGFRKLAEMNLKLKVSNDDVNLECG